MIVVSSAFERVAAARGVEAPKPRTHLTVVPDATVEAPVRPSHRPVRFAEVVGQQRLLMRLETHLKAAVARTAQPGHVLLDGGPGLGKTTIAQALCTELNQLGLTAAFHELTGDSIANPRKLAVELAELAAGDILFIDEVQAMRPPVQTALLRVLEDGVMYVEGSAKQPAIRFDVPAFTLVAATTHPGKLSAPMRDRFKFVGHLEPYEVDDLQLVVLQYAERLECKVEFEAAEVIAKASRYTPRRGVRLMDAVRDYAYEVTGDVDAVIDEETARQGLEYADVDQYGLEERDRRYLRVLVHDFDGGPVGLAPLANALGMDPTELTRDVEHYLIQAGLLRQLPRGRAATRATYTVLGLSVPPILNGWIR